MTHSGSRHIVCVIVCLIASYASAWIVYPARDKRWRH